MRAGFDGADVLVIEVVVEEIGSWDAILAQIGLRRGDEWLERGETVIAEVATDAHVAASGGYGRVGIGRCLTGEKLVQRSRNLEVSAVQQGKAETEREEGRGETESVLLSLGQETGS